MPFSPRTLSQRTSLRAFAEGADWNAFRRVVSLHAHTSHSREVLDDLPAYIRRIPIVGARFERELEMHTGVDLGMILRRLRYAEQLIDLGQNHCERAAVAQRTGRYYDFGLGKLIVERPDDPNSWTSVGGGGQVHRGHFHCCQYEIASGSTQSMYMLYDTHNGVSQLTGGPAVYDWDRRFKFETAAGGVTGHHIYYH